jgi:hypothetical protein
LYKVSYLIAQIVEFVGIGRDVIAVAFAQFVERCGAGCASVKRLQLKDRIEKVPVKVGVFRAEC